MNTSLVVGVEVNSTVLLYCNEYIKPNLLYIPNDLVMAHVPVGTFEVVLVWATVCRAHTRAFSFIRVKFSCLLGGVLLRMIFIIRLEPCLSFRLFFSFSSILLLSSFRLFRCEKSSGLLTALLLFFSLENDALLQKSC